ncbi:hypothetical protein M231_04118 [Tremella mesenterica]|uniref:DNA binding protein Ncp1 n=1 Tax=Tremella mesenterica TaxID=5217 RepID=A0A4Q1BLT7_TREME|nr:hypothetical protein M231_04118 [Tremella mesenterica]
MTLPVAENHDETGALANGVDGLSIHDGHMNGDTVEHHRGSTEKMELGQALADGPHDATLAERPMLRENPSRSYVKSIKSIPIVTTYDDTPDPEPIVMPTIEQKPNRPKSVAASTKGSVKGSIKPNVKRSTSKSGSIAPSTKGTFGPTAALDGNPRPPSRAASRASFVPSHTGEEALGAAVIGDDIMSEKHNSLKRTSLADNGPVPHFEDGDRSMSPRPQSSFGHRPMPSLTAVPEDQREGQFGGRQSRAGMLDRSGTVVSRANTLGRNGTLSRATNGGIVGSRRGAFGRGAGASIGTQPEEVLGRDDIHARAELSERILDDATLRRLATMEKKDAKRLAKVIKAEGQTEHKAVQGSIKELERMVKLQREAAAAERKSQARLSAWTKKEHKARLRFLKEKERYERIEGELRNAENDYEERRDHASGLTAQVAEKTQDLDDLRAQKAADDRERAVKMLALRNPAHS